MPKTTPNLPMQTGTMKVNLTNPALSRSLPCQFTVVLLSFLLVLLANSARATLIAYDPMNYSGAQVNTGTAAPSGTPNQITGTGGGFTGNWSGGALTLNSFGVAYPNLPVAGKSISALGARTIFTRTSPARRVPAVCG